MMPDVTITLPTWENASTVQIEVSVSGRSTKDIYRVITVPCEEDSGPECVNKLRRAVLTVEPGWQLVSIGNPGANGIPLMFRSRETVATPQPKPESTLC
jgi:hypothetical protein